MENRFVFCGSGHLHLFIGSWEQIGGIISENMSLSLLVHCYELRDKEGMAYNKVAGVKK